LRVLQPSRATNFYVAASKSDIYFLQHEHFFAREGGNTRNKQSQLATATLLRDKLHENVARVTGP